MSQPPPQQIQQQSQYIQQPQLVSNSADRRYSEKITQLSKFASNNSPMIRTPKNQKVVYVQSQQQQVQGGNPQILHSQSSQIINGQQQHAVISSRQSGIHNQPQIYTTTKTTNTIPSGQIINNGNVQILSSSPQQQIQVVKSVVQTPPQVIHTKQIIQAASPPSTTFIQASNVHSHIVTQEIKQNQHVQYSSNDELLIKELEAYKKKCAHLETHILQYRQKFEVIKITETQLTEVLGENRTLSLQINEYLMQITQYRQQIEQLNLRLSQVTIFESEYKKIQDLYTQQLIYIDQLKNELIMKSNKIQELLHKDEENQRIIQNLMNQLQGQQQQQDEAVKRSKRDRDNKDKENQDKIDQLNQKLSDKEKELQNILFALSNSENSKNQGEYQLKNLQDSITYLNIEIRNKDELLKQKNADIEKLKEQINNLQINIYQFQNVEQEKQRLQQVIENKNKEIEQWQRSYADQNAKLEELRQQNTNIYILENRINQMKVENDGLRNLCDQRDEDVKRSKNRQKDLEKEADDKKLLQYEISQYEAKLNLYAQEIENITRALQQKVTENEDLKMKLSSLQTQIYQFQHNETIIVNLNQNITNLENEVKASKELAQKQEYEIITLKGRISEGQFQVQQLQQEINNLRALSKDYNQVRQSVNDGELKLIQLNQQINSYQITIQQKDNELEVYRSSNRSLAEENERQKKQIGELQLIVHQLEITLNEVHIQLNIYKETSNTNISLYSQIDQLKIKLTEAELKYEELLKISKFEKEQLENKLVLMSTEIQRKDFMIQSKTQELDNLRPILIQVTEIEIQLRSQQDKNQYLLQEIDRISSENRALIKDLEVWRFKYAEYSILEFKVQDLLQRIVLQSVEIESLRQLANQRAQENTSLRQSQLNIYRN